MCMFLRIQNFHTNLVAEFVMRHWRRIINVQWRKKTAVCGYKTKKKTSTNELESWTPREYPKQFLEEVISWKARTCGHLARLSSARLQLSSLRMLCYLFHYLETSFNKQSISVFKSVSTWFLSLAVKCSWWFLNYYCKEFGSSQA